MKRKDASRKVKDVNYSGNESIPRHERRWRTLEEEMEGEGERMGMMASDPQVNQLVPQNNFSRHNFQPFPPLKIF